MSHPDQQRIFISYAHRDGSDLALSLQSDLQRLGFEVWLDVTRLQAGSTWAKEIESAIDHCDFALVLLSAGSYLSDICRAEQERSLAKRKLVIPIRVQADCDVALPLQTRQYVDFSVSSNYANAFQLLQSSLQERRGLQAADVSRIYHNNSSAVPNSFVDRPDVLYALRNALFQESPARNIALTALQGMGGIGKTVLAQALCRDEVVQQAYPDGIFWFTIGKESSLGFAQRIESLPGLRRMLGDFGNDGACLSQYRNFLRDKAAIVVLDDVWRAGDVAPFPLLSAIAPNGYNARHNARRHLWCPRIYRHASQPC